MFSLMFNTGARVQEILDLRVRDIRIEPPCQVRFTGKGNKVRICPIWPRIARLLRELIENQRDGEDEPTARHVFRNVRGAPTQTIRRVLPARSNTRLALLRAVSGGQPLVYSPQFHYSLGDPAGTAQGYRYPLPWRGGPFRLSQGANGQYSHYGPKNKYAMDIAMPVGTPIIAARAGVVVKTENSQSGRGNDASGNFVRVLHDDGTMGVYLHLKQGSVSVREGQRVTVGSPLALSGNTGNSSGPHLHFVVQRNSGAGLVSIPYQFNQPLGALPNFALGKQ